jgi:AraC-like DNA-binding protein
MMDIGSKLDDAFFGLASSPCPVDSPRFGVELMVLSSTLGEALDRFFRFYAFVTSGLTMSFETEARDAVVEIRATAPELDPKHFLIEWYAARIISFSQWLTGHELSRFSVEFSHRQQLPISAYTAALGNNLSFDKPANTITMPRQYLGMDVIRTLNDFANLTAKRYDPEHQSIAHRQWASLVRSTLRDSLAAMRPLPTMEDLARKFGVSSQTLRRNLRAEGMTYREIKAEARRDIVINKMTNTSLSLGEISMLAGFAEPNGLLRAMKIWTGLSGTAFRREVLKQNALGKAEVDDED